MINFKETIDRELIRIIKNPDTPESIYQKACEEILDRYSRQIHKNWWVLQKQMDNSDIINSLKEDYYDEAYEAFFKAIQKTDISKIENDNWKFVGMLKWYLANVRKKLILETKKQSKFKYLSTMSLLEDEESNTIDSDVEKSYQNEYGYKHDPSYIYEITEGENNCKSGIKKCLENWTDDEKSIYKLLEQGNSKATVAKLLGIEPNKIYSITNKMCKDMKMALNYAS